MTYFVRVFLANLLVRLESDKGLMMRRSVEIYLIIYVIFLLCIDQSSFFWKMWRT